MKIDQMTAGHALIRDIKLNIQSGILKGKLFQK